MLEPTPARDDNAIAEVAFGVSLQQANRDSKFVKKFINLEGEIKDFLPGYDLIDNRSLQLQSNLNSNSQPPSISLYQPGVMRYQDADDVPGRKEWILRVESDRVVVVCTEYASWRKVSTTAINLLNLALLKLDNPDREVLDVIFQCSDAFISSDYKSEVGNIFSKNSSVIPRHIFSKENTNWHAHQGWIDRKLKSRFLHNFNINVSTSVKDSKKSTTTLLTHTVKISQADTVTVTDIINHDTGGKKLSYPQKVFNESHRQNKIIIKDLLNKKMLKRIGLDD